MTQTISFKIPIEERERFERLALADGYSNTSELLRRLVRLFIQCKEQTNNSLEAEMERFYGNMGD